MCTGVSVCGGPVGRVILLAEIAFCSFFFHPGAKFYSMVWMLPRPKLEAAFTLIVDAGGIRISASKLAIPVPCVASVSTVASVSDTYGAAKAVVPYIEKS